MLKSMFSNFSESFITAQSSSFVLQNLFDFLLVWFCIAWHNQMHDHGITAFCCIRRSSLPIFFHVFCLWFPLLLCPSKIGYQMIINHFLLYPSKYGTLFKGIIWWGEYCKWIRSGTAVFKLNLSSNPSKHIILKSYFVYSRSEAAKAFIKKKFYTNKSLAIMYFYDITVQQYHTASPGKNYLLGFTFPAVLHTASLFIMEFILNINVTSQFLQVR